MIGQTSSNYINAFVIFVFPYLAILGHVRACFGGLQELYFLDITLRYFGTDSGFVHHLSLVLVVRDVVWETETKLKTKTQIVKWAKFRPFALCIPSVSRNHGAHLFQIVFPFISLTALCVLIKVCPCHKQPEIWGKILIRNNYFYWNYLPIHIKRVKYIKFPLRLLGSILSLCLIFLGLGVSSSSAGSLISGCGTGNGAENGAEPCPGPGLEMTSFILSIPD